MTQFNTPPQTPLNESVTETQKSAKAQIEQTLGQYGLASLATWAWNQYLNNVQPEQIFLNMRQTPEYKARFPAMEYIAQQGRALNEGQYIDYERKVGQIFQAAGMPVGFYDTPDDFTKFIKNDVSPDEIQGRVNVAKQAVFNSDPATLQALSDYYGINHQNGNFIGDATAYFLDDTRALPAIEKQMIAAQTGGAATRTGYGTLSQMDAERLASLGITAEQAQKGFGDLAGLQPIFSNLPGDANNTAPTQQQGLQATFEDNAAAKLAVSTEQARRKARFQEGGGFSTSQKGISGLG
jgi:hypothetical protein